MEGVQKKPVSLEDKLYRAEKCVKALRGKALFQGSETLRKTVSVYTMSL